jgi:hypothetical protein
VLPREIIEQSERDATPFLEANNQVRVRVGVRVRVRVRVPLPRG